MMALQVCAAAPRTTTTKVRNPAWQGFIAKQPTMVCVKGKQRGTNSGLKCSSDAVTAVAEVGQVTDVDKDTFWPIVKAAGDKTVVVDMYTQWCGPCKLMAPKYAKLSENYTDVVFLKLDCNQENKPLAKELGIKVVPTFKILKDSKIVKVITGAKFDDLVGAIEVARAL